VKARRPKFVIVVFSIKSPRVAERSPLLALIEETDDDDDDIKYKGLKNNLKYEDDLNLLLLFTL